MLEYRYIERGMCHHSCSILVWYCSFSIFSQADTTSYLFECCNSLVWEKALGMSLRNSHESNQKDFPNFPRGGGGRWGTQKSFIRGGSAPRANPLPFYIPFFQNKHPIRISFIRKRHPFRIRFIRKRHPFHIPS